MKRQQKKIKGDLSTLGGKILHLRTQHHIGQKEFALYLHVSVSTISNYENNVHQPDVPTLIKIADYFNVSTDYLLNRTQYSYPISYLETQRVDRYTVASFFDSVLQLSKGSQTDLVKYLNLLKIQDASNKKRQNS